MHFLVSRAPKRRLYNTSPPALPPSCAKKPNSFLDLSLRIELSIQIPTFRRVQIVETIEDLDLADS